MAQYYRYPAVVVNTGPLEFTRNGVNQAVVEDTATPANNRPLPVELTGPNGPVTSTVSGPNVALDVNVVAGGSSNVNIHDAAGNNLTSQVNGAQRALDVGIDVAGVQVDPRAIRALTSADVVTDWVHDGTGVAITSTVNGPKTGLDVNIVNAGGTSNVNIFDSTGNSITSQANGAQHALDVGIDVAGVQIDPRFTFDGAGTPITSTLNAGKQSLDVNVTGGGSSNASVAPTGAAVPADATYIGADLAGNLVGLVATANGLKVDGSAVTQPENLTQVGGAAIALGQTTMANSLPVVIASNQTSLPVSEGGLAKVNLIRNDYTITPVTTGAYVQLVASTAAQINLLDIFDSSGQTLVFAVGAAAAEVDQFYVYPGGNGRIPLSIPTASRLSIKAVSANASVGELDINTFG